MPILPRDTIAVANYLHGEDALYWLLFHTASSIYTPHHFGGKLVDAHKSLFGKQTYCTLLGRRYWVWEFEGYVVYVNNEGGISLEVNAESSPEQARDVIRDFAKAWPFDMEEIVQKRNEEGLDTSEFFKWLHETLKRDVTDVEN